MAVLTATVKDDVFFKVEKFAREAERPRDEIVDEAIDSYLKRAAWNRYCESGYTPESRKAAAEWLTDEDVIRFVDEVVHPTHDLSGRRR
ncbi:MAG: ribbon-helix-helix domain-containing protein [Chitinispirillales bacterium]|jgi:predicted transcriptional regulator|nr:ribbon-helix-helix domain-containing protein [Chitinispirillales bacterium]